MFLDQKWLSLWTFSKKYLFWRCWLSSIENLPHHGVLLAHYSPKENWALSTGCHHHHQHHHHYCHNHHRHHHCQCKLTDGILSAFSWVERRGFSLLPNTTRFQPSCVDMFIIIIIIIINGIIIIFILIAIFVIIVSIIITWLAMAAIICWVAVPPIPQVSRTSSPAVF